MKVEEVHNLSSVIIKVKLLYMRSLFLALILVCGVGVWGWGDEIVSTFAKEGVLKFAVFVSHLNLIGVREYYISF